MKTDEARTAAEQDIVVFSILRPAVCSECGAELAKGSLLRMHGEDPFCLDCADLGYLMFLPSGDAALASTFG